jgi:hypothetical protein
MNAIESGLKANVVMVAEKPAGRSMAGIGFSSYAVSPHRKSTGGSLKAD